MDTTSTQKHTTDCRTAYLTRKLDIRERELALKERELDLQERALTHKIESDARHDAEMEEARKSLQELQDSIRGTAADDLPSMFRPGNRHARN